MCSCNSKGDEGGCLANGKITPHHVLQEAIRAGMNYISSISVTELTAMVHGVNRFSAIQ